MTAAASSSAKQQILSELARELAMRRNVFPKWIESGKLKQEVADERVRQLQFAYDYVRDNMPNDFEPKVY